MKRIIYEIDKEKVKILRKIEEGEIKKEEACLPEEVLEKLNIVLDNKIITKIEKAGMEVDEIFIEEK